KTRWTARLDCCSATEKRYDGCRTRDKLFPKTGMNLPPTVRDWDERTGAPERLLQQSGAVFESFFERSVDAVWLFDPQAGVFVDCNQAAVNLIGAASKAQLLQATPADLSPPDQ